MFGISPLGWVHTLGSLPAIPAAIYLFARYGRIVPRSPAGTVYFFSMLIGAVSVVFIAHEPVSYIIAGATLVLLLAGYGVGRLPVPEGIRRYAETIFLSITAFNRRQEAVLRLYLISSFCCIGVISCYHVV